MNYTNIFFLLFISGTAFSFIISFILEKIDFNFRKKHGTEIPEVIKDHVDSATLEKTCRYEDAKYKFWLPAALISVMLNVYLVCMCFYPAVFRNVFSWTQNSFLVALLYIVLVSIPGMIISIPFDLYRIFGIEKQFGFNNMTAGTWIADQIKNIIISLIIAAPLLFAATSLLKYFSEWWWLLLGLIYLAFNLGISLIYPIFIAPLFNKFTPLEEGELKTKLEALLKKCGFKSSGVFVMDASKRTGHSNAYFTGFGKSKRVVLYDTLIAQLTADEIESVLGHELGHYKHHHIVKRLAVMIPLIFALLYGMSLFIKLPYLYFGYGFELADGIIPHQMLIVGIMLLAKSFEGWSELLSPVFNFFSRKDEFQADAFAKKVCGTEEHLVTALIKLNKENLSEIQVPKIYSAFHYSHPPLLERIDALRK